MTSSKIFRRGFLILMVCSLLLAGAFQTAAAKDVHLEATYTLTGNGDVDVIMKLTTSMNLYQKMRQSVSNLYLLLRNLSSQRAELEVENKKADWDDAGRTITISYKALGMARNLGDHWEFDLAPQSEFSNLDEDQRTVYFNEEVVSPLGKIAGRSKLILPPEAQQYRWDGARRVVSYVMPQPQPAAGRKGRLFTAAGLFFILGAVAFGVSFISRPKPPASGQAGPPQLLEGGDREGKS